MLGTIEIPLSFLRLLLGVALLAIPAYVYYLYDRQSLRGLAVSVGRMLVQMAVLGACLWAVWTVDSFWLTLLWLAIMSLVSAVVVCRRARLSQRLLPWIAIGTFVGVLILLLYLLWVVVRPAEPLSARWVVPVAGVLIGHVMTTNIYALSVFYRRLQTNRDEYETLMGNGRSHLRALAPFFGCALQAMARPAVAYLSVTGLLAMPLLLSGELLAGLEPVGAVMLTVLLIVASLTASVLVLLFVLFLADRYTFDRRGNLLNVIQDKENQAAD
jgi:putative ABC transport system permease protein